MLKQTIEYTDFNDEKQVETLYFNITKAQLTDHLELADELTELQKKFEGEQRDLTTTEVRQILNLVKTFIKIAYGERSEDGRRHKKTEEVWQNFKDSAAYDAFLYSLFEDPQKAYSFLLGVMPKDLREQAETQVRTNQPDLFASVVEETPVSEEVKDDRPAWIRENREPTKAELTTMTPEQLRDAFSRKLSNA